MSIDHPLTAIPLNDEVWEHISRELPRAARTGRPRANDRATVAAILYVLEKGIRWCDLPRSMGSYVTAWRRYRDWSEAGVWARVWRVIGAQLEPGELEELEERLEKNPRARQKGVLAGREIWTEPEALEAAIDALVEGYFEHGGVSAVSISNEGLELNWGL